MASLSLREENDLLREQVTQLKRQLGYEASVDFVLRAKRVFGISRTEALILNLLLTGKMQSRDAIFSACYGDRSDPPDEHLPAVWIRKLRIKLEPHRIAIRTEWCVGYWMDTDACSRAKALLLGPEVAA